MIHPDPDITRAIKETAAVAAVGLATLVFWAGLFLLVFW